MNVWIVVPRHVRRKHAQDFGHGTGIAYGSRESALAAIAQHGGAYGPSFYEVLEARLTRYRRQPLSPAAGRGDAGRDGA